MLRPAYAVEYDYLPAHQCHASLETKKIRGLFFSGQLNGTTGGGGGGGGGGRPTGGDERSTRAAQWHNRWERGAEGWGGPTGQVRGQLGGATGG